MRCGAVYSPCACACAVGGDIEPSRSGGLDRGQAMLGGPRAAGGVRGHRFGALCATGCPERSDGFVAETRAQGDLAHGVQRVADGGDDTDDGGERARHLGERGGGGSDDHDRELGADVADDLALKLALGAAIGVVVPSLSEKLDGRGHALDGVAEALEQLQMLVHRELLRHLGRELGEVIWTAQAVADRAEAALAGADREPDREVRIVDQAVENVVDPVHDGVVAGAEHTASEGPVLRPHRHDEAARDVAEPRAAALAAPRAIEFLRADVGVFRDLALGPGVD